MTFPIVSATRKLILTKTPPCTENSGTPEIVPMVLFSDKTIDSINMHFTVHPGVTLTFRAPAINIKRDEVRRRVKIRGRAVTANSKRLFTYAVL